MNFYYRRLRDLREDSDRNQTEIAALLNTRQEYYSKYELGKIEIPVHHLVTLADYYNVSVDYILGRTDETKPYPKTKFYLTAARSKGNKPKEWREIDVEKIKNAPETDEDL